VLVLVLVLVLVVVLEAVDALSITRTTRTTTIKTLCIWRTLNLGSTMVSTFKPLRAGINHRPYDRTSISK
jgi:hypothetical protein